MDIYKIKGNVWTDGQTDPKCRKTLFYKSELLQSSVFIHPLTFLKKYKLLDGCKDYAQNTRNTFEKREGFKSDIRILYQIYQMHKIFDIKG